MELGELMLWVVFVVAIAMLVIMIILTERDKKKERKQLQEKLNKTKWSQKNGWEIEYVYKQISDWDDEHTIINLKNYERREKQRIDFIKTREGVIKLIELKNKDFYY
jgi:hypothetical protein